MSRLFLGLPAPAKLNLFLHVLGQRTDGYHELQSAFVLIDLHDTLDFEERADGRIERSGDLMGAVEHDLAVRAARALRDAAGVDAGVSIHIDKRIPAGAGMGGGSSDAATTLIALNRLWRLDWPRERLAQLALQLGADVPFFLGQGAAFVEGIGEQVTPLEWPNAWYAIVYPGVAVPTAAVFREPGLTRDSKPTIISTFSRSRTLFPAQLFGTNDLQAVAVGLVPAVGAALEWLGRHGAARMTGSGSAVFVALASEREAQAAIADLPDAWQGFVALGCAEHPLAAW